MTDLTSIDWHVFAPRAIRDVLYVVGLPIAALLPGRLADVPYRRGLLFSAFGLGLFSSCLFTLINSGIWHTTSNLMVFGGVLSSLVVALWTAIILVTAYGPRPWER